MDCGDGRKLDEMTGQSLASDSGWKYVGFYLTDKSPSLLKITYLLSPFFIRSTDQLSLASFGSKTANKLTLNKSMSRNGGTWGSISRVFSRASKQRKTLDLSIYEGKMVHFFNHANVYL